MAVLQAVVTLLCIFFFLGVMWQVRSGRMLLRYALLWMGLSLLTLLCALFPDAVFSLAHILDFESPSNFILLIGLFFLLAICLSLSMIVSRQALKIKNVIQELALLEDELKKADEGQDGA